VKAEHIVAADFPTRDVVAVVTRVLEVSDTIDPEANFVTDLAIDSLRFFELVVALEERFAIAFEPREVDAMRSLSDVLRLTRDRVMRGR
jgi:acyl carrier protein